MKSSWNYVIDYKTTFPFNMPTVNTSSMIIVDGVNWKIVPTSCACGGGLAWMKQRPSGAYEMVGCICHNTPSELIGEHDVMSVDTETQD